MAARRRTSCILALMRTMDIILTMFLAEAQVRVLWTALVGVLGTVAMEGMARKAAMLLRDMEGMG